ncbi:MAG: hypothetical protein ACXVZX_11010 [Terriglobales bacterium]
MDRKPCEHIMDSGPHCASPRMNNRNFCYWHQRLHTAHYLPNNPKYEPPVLDSANAVVLALNHVFRGQSRGLIDGKTARPLQQSLRLALQAFRVLDRPLPTEMVTDDTSSADTPVRSSEAAALATSTCVPNAGLSPTAAAPNRSAGVSPPVARASSPAPSPTHQITSSPDHQISSAHFTRLADSALSTRLTPEKERTIAQVIRRAG